MDNTTARQYYQALYNIGSGDNINQAEAIMQNMLSHKLAVKLHQYNLQNAEQNRNAFELDRQLAGK